MQLAMLLDSCKLAIKCLKKWMSPEKVCVSFASRVSVVCFCPRFDAWLVMGFEVCFELCCCCNKCIKNYKRTKFSSNAWHDLEDGRQ